MGTLCLFFGILCGFLDLASSKFQVGSQASKQATFERLDGSCPGHNVSIIYDVQGLRNEGSKMIMNSTITVKYDVLTEPTVRPCGKMMVTIDRCKSKENLDTCEHFRAFKTNKYCAMLAANSGLWDSYFKSFTPTWKCPLKKGVYRSINSMIDLSAFLLLTGDDWFWRVKCEVREKRTNRMLFCLFADAVISSVQNQADATA